MIIYELCAFQLRMVYFRETAIEIMSYGVFFEEALGMVVHLDLKNLFSSSCSNTDRTNGEVFPRIKKIEGINLKTLQSKRNLSTKPLIVAWSSLIGKLKILHAVDVLSGSFAFKLYDTYGFPIDLTELMARESGLTVNKQEFDLHAKNNEARARKARKSVDVLVSEDVENSKMQRIRRLRVQ